MRPPFNRNFVPGRGAKPTGERPILTLHGSLVATLPTKPKIGQETLLSGLATPKVPLPLPIKPVQRGRPKFGPSQVQTAVPYHFLSELGDKRPRFNSGNFKPGHFVPVKTF